MINPILADLYAEKAATISEMTVLQIKARCIGDKITAMLLDSSFEKPKMMQKKKEAVLIPIETAQEKAEKLKTYMRDKGMNYRRQKKYREENPPWPIVAVPCHQPEGERHYNCTGKFMRTRSADQMVCTYCKPDKP